MLITLTTDFGTGSPYVAEMKGVILSAAPAATIVDLSHAIPPQDVRTAAMLLAQMTRHFPPETIHIAVVDPGVGTERRLVCVEADRRFYLAPDNGLLTLVVRGARRMAAREIAESSLWRAEVSATFHGRDILAPVAAALALGLATERVGPLAEDLVEIVWPEPQVGDRTIAGEIVLVDAFGNAISNIPGTLLTDILRRGVRVQAGDLPYARLVATYGEATPGTLVALVGSSGWLELAVVNGNAAGQFGLQAGTPVTVSW
jgi:S-adenosylmethionine hydrolase